MLTDRYFMPDRCFDDIYMITPEFLLAEGIRAVLLDIDNTLVTYDDPEPTEPCKLSTGFAHKGYRSSSIKDLSSIMFSFFPFVKFIIGFIEYTFDNYQSLKSPTGNSNILQFHYKLGREIIFYLKNILISHPICYKSVY